MERKRVLVQTCRQSQMSVCLSLGRGEARILHLGGLSPGHGERGSASLYIRYLGAEPPAEVQGAEPWWGPGERSPPPPEAESSVAFEALA